MTHITKTRNSHSTFMLVRAVMYCTRTYYNILVHTGESDHPYIMYSE